MRQFLRRVLKDRIYKSGTGIQWCFLLWSDAQLPYLDRLFLFKTPWFSASLNWILQKDVGHPHDHTAAFVSIPLWGWYVERRILRDPKTRRVRMDRFILRSFLNWNYMRACDWDTHRIMVVKHGGMLSLCLMGPKVREWYYHENDGTMVHWSKYKP